MTRSLAVAIERVRYWCPHRIRSNAASGRAWRHRTLLWLVLLTAVSTAGVTDAWAHGGLPINVFLREEGKLFASKLFESGPFTQFEGSIFTDLPGLAVLSPGNRIPHGANLGIDILSGINFWDGQDLVPTDVQLTVEAPTVDGFGHRNVSEVASYLVTSESGYLSGLNWGIYDGTVPGWDTHGRFSLSPLTAPTGVYGIVIQVTSPGVLPSDPILVPFAYDPSGLGELTSSEYDAGIVALSEWAERTWTPLEAGDANQDLRFDQTDLISVFQAGKYRKDEPASWQDGDWNGAPDGRIGMPPAGDGRFDESDLIAAFQNGWYLNGSYVNDGRTLTIPEPQSQLTMMIGFALLSMHPKRKALPKK